MVHKVNDVKQIVYFIKSFTQNFKKRYHHKRKESQGSNPRNCLLVKAPEEKSHQDMSLYESFDFSEGVFGVAKIAFSLERLYGRIFLTLGEHYFQGFFPSVFFSQAKEKIHREKIPAETYSMKIQVKSGEILVRKTAKKVMQTQIVADLYLNW